MQENRIMKNIGGSLLQEINLLLAEKMQSRMKKL